jgi:hypothetical protein
MSGNYEITVSITALCVCCGKELPSSAYLTESRASEGVFHRDNPHERKDRRVFITPCADCFVPRAAVAELIETVDAFLQEGHGRQGIRDALARAKGGAA